MKEKLYEIRGIELIPADPEGWWCMVRGSTDSDEWTIGDTPQESLAKFLERYD